MRKKKSNLEFANFDMIYQSKSMQLNLGSVLKSLTIAKQSVDIYPYNFIVNFNYMAVFGPDDKTKNDLRGNDMNSNL